MFNKKKSKQKPNSHYSKEKIQTKTDPLKDVVMNY